MTSALAGQGSRTLAIAAVRKGGERNEERLAAAALYRLIAAGFTYPEPAIVDAVRRGAQVLAATTDRTGVRSLCGPLLRSLTRAWRMASAQELGGEYSRLFLGAGLVPLREGGYGDGLRFAGQPVDIADLNGFYHAFGFALPATAPNPPDHVGAELEFVSLLHLKAAHALGRGRLRDARVVDHALARFLEDHLARWAPSFERALGEARAAHPYSVLARLMTKVVAGDCARFRVKPSLAAYGTSYDPMAAETLVCPLAGTEAGREQRGGGA